jgi:2-dehydro-3-deoxy-D-arabinonate dehydratase
MYRRCAALGPVIAFAWEHERPHDAAITLVIRRAGKPIFEGTTSTGQMHRTFADLVGYLFRDNDFPRGAFLMTGTGIIPPSEFTLQDGDEVAITIDGIGSLVNPVVRLA